MHKILELVGMRKKPTNQELLGIAYDERKQYYYKVAK